MDSVSDLVVAQDDPRRGDVVGLLRAHLDHARACTLPGHVFALDIDGLVDPAITFCSARLDGRLVGVGALRELDPLHGEVKSMHTASTARRAGIGAAIVAHLVGIGRARGYERISLETGAQPDFAPAREMYARTGFTVCGPFGDYPDSEHSVFMTLLL